MQIQSKSIMPQSSPCAARFKASPQRTRPGENIPPLLVFSVVVLLTLFAIVEIDLHSAQLQAIGLLSHGAGINSVFLSP